MDPDVAFFLTFVGGALLFFGMLALLVRKALRLQRQMMGELAKDLGLPLSGSEAVLPGIPGLGWIRKAPRVEGALGNRYVKIDHFQRGSGKQRKTYAKVQCPLKNPHGLRLHVAKENFLSRLGRNLGMPDVEIGDEKFDKQFVVKSKHPDFARTVLIPELRELFYKAWDEHAARGYLKVDVQDVRYEEPGSISRGAVKRRFVVLARLCAQIAEATEIYSEALTEASREKE